MGSDGVSDGANGWTDITGAVLVETPGAAVQYAETVALILGVIAPKAELHVVHAEATPEAL